jgi:uncharacterized protein
MTSIKTINEFLSLKNFAVVGVSKDRKKFGNSVYRSLKTKGYNVYPVNNTIDEIEGEKCYSDLTSLKNIIEGVIIVVPSISAVEVTKEAINLGIKNIWLQQGSESEEVIGLCEKNNVSFISKECILMFAQPLEFVHRFHRSINKVFGKYPV